jgi:hypothetical protein
MLALRMRSAYEADHKLQVRRAQYSGLVTSQSALGFEVRLRIQARPIRTAERAGQTRLIMKKRSRLVPLLSPPMIAAAIAAVCLIILAGLVYQRSGDPSDETMFSAARTETSAQAAGATVSPTKSR